MFHDVVVLSFLEIGFMQRVLPDALMSTFSAYPVGAPVMMQLMSLTGEAMANAMLAHEAALFLFYELGSMSLGPTTGGLTVGVAARLTVQITDTPRAAFYVIALSFGFVMVSLPGSSVDLFRAVFGRVLARIVVGWATTLCAFESGERALVAE